MRFCGTSLIKYILFAFNVIFAISGLVLILAGGIAAANLNDSSYFLERKIFTLPIVLIVTGALIFLIAALGCFGAVRESPSLLLLYAILLVIVFIIELAVGIAACSIKNSDSFIRNSLQNSIQRSKVEDMMAWNYMQSKLMCCGVENPSDWRTMSLNQTLPSSCCRPEYIEPRIGHCKDSFALGIDKYYQEGCFIKLKDVIDTNINVLMGIGIGIAFLQFCGVLLVCYLAASLRSQSTD